VSNLDPDPEAISLTPGVVQAVDVIEARKAAIGDGTEVRRLLPQRTLRTIGAWCFLDHYGPDEVSRGPGMQVPPHPHIGLQTVSRCLACRSSPAEASRWCARTDGRGRARTSPVRPQDPYWCGTGSLVTGIRGAGLANTSCWAVSSPASAAARVMAAGDRG
jgi:Pirin